MNTNLIEDEDLNDPALSELFDALRALGEDPAPPIRPELAALLAGTSVVPSFHGGRRVAVRAGVIGLVGTALVAGGLGAAAADELPRPAQHVVSTVVNKLTPFEIPNPDEHGPIEHQKDATVEDEGNQPGQDVDAPPTTPEPRRLHDNKPSAPAPDDSHESQGENSPDDGGLQGTGTDQGPDTGESQGAGGGQQNQSDADGPGGTQADGSKGSSGANQGDQDGAHGDGGNDR